MIIDPKSNIPIYRQIVSQVRDSIDAGVYRAGEALPSLWALAVEIQVNPNTVQRAYEELEREGVIESRRGIGVFVVERQGKAARKKREREVVAVFQRGIDAALAAELQPVRIRELFESALSSGLASARKQK